MTTVEQFQTEALHRWLNHFYTCAESLGIDVDSQERNYAEESWHDSKQIRLIEHDSVLKIKWEHRCWWGDCPHPRNFEGAYECILVDIPVTMWEEPYARAIRLEESR